MYMALSCVSTVSVSKGLSTRVYLHSAMIQVHPVTTGLHLFPALSGRSLGSGSQVQFLTYNSPAATLPAPIPHLEFTSSNPSRPNSSPIIHQQPPFTPQLLTYDSPASTLSSPWPDCTLLTPRALGIWDIFLLSITTCRQQYQTCQGDARSKNICRYHIGISYSI